jgi:NADPH-dependent 2,4-dienoyl-CoA reductase/sulfur reductase-like enzyme
VPSPWVTIDFEGHSLRCRADTSVAVALWEQGIRVLSHSPKFGRPRGLHCARGLCTGCLMRVDGVPHVRTCQTPVRDRMRVERQGGGPFYAGPLRRALDMAGTLAPVGFYFKWFTRPAALSRLFLKQLRPLTGHGRLPDPEVWRAPRPPAQVTLTGTGGPAAGQPPRFDHVVVGAGLSGLRAAQGLTGRTLLVDDQPEPGGQRWPVVRDLARQWGTDLERFPCLAALARSLHDAIDRLPARADLERAFARRVVAGYWPDQLLLKHGAGLSVLRALSLHWMAGGLDRLGLFPGNDLPGLFGPRGLYRLLARDRMQVRNSRVVVTGGGLDLWLAASALHGCGAKVSVVLSEEGWPHETTAAVDLRWRLHAGYNLASVRPRGRSLALAFMVREDDPAFLNLECDFAVVARPGKPVYDIPYQLGVPLVLDPERGGYAPRDLKAGRFDAELDGGLTCHIAGEAAGQRPEALVALSDHGEVRV